MKDASDFYDLDARLTDAQRALRRRLRDWVEARVLPAINARWEAAEPPRALWAELPSLGILGGMLTGHGCAGLDALSWGLARYELARGDGSLATFYGVHSGLAMGAIGTYGDADQQARWLPAMARLERIGCFALSEPDHGSDAAGLQTVARPDGDAWTLHGAKRWIGAATVAHLLVVCARDDGGRFGLFVVERDDPGAPTAGLELHELRGKLAKRAIPNAALRFDGVRAHRLTGIDRFRDLGQLLTATRYTIAWEGAGIASACLDAALARARERRQFGKPIGGFQLVQARLARMTAAVTQAQWLCVRLAELLEAGEATPARVSLAKLTCTRAARDVAADARALLGGDGILLEHHVARWLTDAEAALTYEGTEEINTLIVGQALTGEPAFR